jgi:hypothetical protein
VSAVTETAVVFLGVDSLAGTAIVGYKLLRTSRPGRTRGPQTTAARPGHDSALPGPAAASRAPDAPTLLLGTTAVVRSATNPGLAEFAARRPRNANGQFIPLGRAS